MDFLYILCGIAVVIFFVIITYNRLVALRQNREQAFADIDVQLKLRFDLVPQLVETVKGYASHEKDVFENITKARAGIREAGDDISQRVQAENALSKAMFNIFAVAEAYPDLKADQSFEKLMTELSDIENKLGASRRFFNNATAELNTAVEQFPAVLFAGSFGFQKESFFEIPETEREAMDKAPEVKF